MLAERAAGEATASVSGGVVTIGSFEGELLPPSSWLLLLLPLLRLLLRLWLLLMVSIALSVLPELRSPSPAANGSLWCLVWPKARRKVHRSMPR